MAALVTRSSRIPFPQRWGRTGSKDVRTSIVQQMVVPSTTSATSKTSTSTTRRCGFSTSILAAPAPSSWIGRHYRPHPSTGLFGSPSGGWKSLCDSIRASWWGNGMLGSLTGSGITARHKHTFKTNKSVAKRFRARGDGTLIRCVHTQRRAEQLVVSKRLLFLSENEY